MGLTDLLGLGWVRWVAAGIAVLAIAGAGAKLEHWRMSGQAEAAKRETSELREQHARELAKATERTLAVQAGVADDITEGVKHERARAASLAASLAVSDDVRRRLQHAVTELAGRAAADPVAGPSGGGEAAAGPGLVLAELYRGTDDRAEDLARALDRSIGAGQLCERAYDSAQARLRQP